MALEDAFTMKEMVFKTLLRTQEKLESESLNNGNLCLSNLDSSRVFIKTMYLNL